MDQLTPTQSKSRFRPVKVTAAGLPAGPLPDRSVSQDPVAKPAIIRAVDGDGKARLVRQDEVSHSRPRMLPEQRLERYVQNWRASNSLKRSAQQPILQKPSHSAGSIESSNTAEGLKAGQQQNSSPIVTWTTPQASRAIDLSEVSLIRPNPIRQVHSAHSAPEPHLREWPEESEAAAEVEAPLEQTAKLDEQLRRLEMRIENLRSKEAATTEAGQSDREKAILANPNTSDLVTAISTAIVSALQEKPEAEVLPQAKSLFEKSLRQHAVVLDEYSDSADGSEASDQFANEAMLSSIAAQRQQTQQAVAISNISTTQTLKKLRDRIGDYQRMMTHQSTAEAANLVKLSEVKPSEFEPTGKRSVTVDPLRSTNRTTDNKNRTPVVHFTSPENAAIPLDVASWDVEDFRWPALTNQMLISGGSAIKDLLTVAMERSASKTKRIVVAGAGRGQGTTTIAISLARAAINAGYKTLLIDADVASPQLSQSVGLSAKMSWLNGIGNDLPLGESVIRSKKSNLCLMPLTSNVKRVTWPRFIFDNLGEMMIGTESHFDLILIDAGPASQLLDELSSPELLLDATVLVDSTAKLKEIEVYQNRLQTFGVNNLVLAENRKSETAIGAA